MNTKLAEMLTYRRPHNSEGEEAFVKRFITDVHTHMVLGPMENIVITVGDGSHTLFSCHTDTVHRDDQRQKLVYDSVKNHFYKKDGTPLGADDGAGVWLLLEMIEAGVPGTYVFHRGEERGGIGSSWLEKHESEWLLQFDRAVAFDRKATYSVITHQGRGRCCSDTFGEALADALNRQNDDFMYAIDDSGVFTDTANYTELIPECTNVSCGYYKEHGPDEYLDVAHLEALRAACIALDWEALPTERQPAADLPLIYALDGFSGMDYDDILGFCLEDPDSVADMIYAEYCRPLKRFAS